jgi:putative oxidoreductase
MAYPTDLEREAPRAASAAANRRDEVGRSGIFPASEAASAPADALVRTAGELGHPETVAQHRADRWRDTTGSNLFLLGRALVGGFYLYNGINHFTNAAMMSGYAKSKGVPAADIAVPGAGVLLTLGGLSLLTGVKPKVGAAMIATFLAGVTPMMHRFWEAEGQERMGETVNFMKNVALFGSALLATQMPEPWPHSVRVGSLAPARG